MPGYKHFLKTPFIHYETEQVLRAPVSILIGVNEIAAETLKKLQVHTVFDLAYCRVLLNARTIDHWANGTVPMSKFRLIPSDIIKHGTDYGNNVENLAAKNIEVLDGIGEALQQEITQVLGVQTVRELANWPPFLASQLIAGEQINLDNDYTDPGVPDELVPKFNEYPTEKVFYSVYTIDDIKDVQGLQEFPGSIDVITAPNVTSNKIRTGYIVRYEQSWNATGLALGNLLHSLALAPGESTRIAIIDWKRRQGVRTDEAVSQVEALSNTMLQTRSINEVTRAVAREAQSGFSDMHSNSTVSNTAYSTYGIKNPGEALTAAAAGALVGGAALGTAGMAAGAGAGAVAGLFAGAAAAGVGAPLGLVVGAAAGAAIGGGAGVIVGAAGGGVAAGLAAAQFGASQENGSNTTVDVVSTNSTEGSREIAAEMAQNIMDRTQQNSNSSRNRTASFVQEVSQSETEQISTRVVTNYNHMHALTVQYFEVVQMYNVKVRAVEATPCLYVPFKSITWTHTLIKKYRHILLMHSLDMNITIALLNEEKTTIVSNASFQKFTKEHVTDLLNLDNNYNKSIDKFLSDTGKDIGKTVLDDLKMPPDAELEGVMEDGTKLEVELTDGSVKFLMRAGAANNQPIPFEKISKVYLHVFKGIYDLEDGDLLPVQIGVRMHGQRSKLQLPIKFDSSLTTDITHTFRLPFLNCYSTLANSAVLDHLNANTRYYTTKIYQALREFDYAHLFSGYKYKGKPMLDCIDLTPLAISGNYIIFKSNLSQNPKEFEDWKASHGFYTVKSELIPLGTGGVFAEAVMGRANASEKLDITRFWNWQDSPIPIVAPEIAPIQSGTRATAVDGRPGTLDQPVLQVQAPHALPDPTGMSSILSAITVSNMFRDMSGMAYTAQLAQTALENATKGATSAGEQSSGNLKQGMEMTKALLSQILKMSSDFATLLTQTGFAGFGINGKNLGNSNPSVAGAAINQGQKMDEAKKAEQQKNGNNAGATGGNGNAAGGSNNNSAGGTNTNAGGGSGPQSFLTQPDHESDAFNNTIGGGSGFRLASFTPEENSGGNTLPEPTVNFRFGEHANDEVISEYTLDILKELMIDSKIPVIDITSTHRTPADQARIMYNNCERNLAKQKELYGTMPGGKVIEVYESGVAASKTKAEIIADMEAKIIELGPGNVSHHAGDFTKLQVVDIDPSTISKQKYNIFVSLCSLDDRFSTKIFPPHDDAIHLEIPQPEVRVPF